MICDPSDDCLSQITNRSSPCDSFVTHLVTRVAVSLLIGILACAASALAQQSTRQHRRKSRRRTEREHCRRHRDRAKCRHRLRARSDERRERTLSAECASGRLVRRRRACKRGSPVSKRSGDHRECSPNHRPRHHPARGAPGGDGDGHGGSPLVSVTSSTIGQVVETSAD